MITDPKIHKVLLDQINDSVFMIDPKTGAVLDCNNSACRNLGYTREKLLQLRVSDFSSAADSDQAWREISDKIIQSGSLIRLTRHRKRDGSEIPVELNAHYVVDGEQRYFITVARDITDREMVGIVLKDSQEKYQEIFNATTDGIFVHEEGSGRVIDVNKASVKIFGYSSREELLATPFSDLTIGTKPYSFEDAQGWINRSLEEGTQTFEWLAKRKNGEKFWAEVTLLCSVLEGKRRVLATFRDIDKQKRMGDRLRESESRYADLYENAPDMYVSVDAKTCLIKECNTTLTRALGLSKEEIIGHPIFDVYHPDSLDGAKEAFEQFITTGEVKDKELQLKRKDGSPLDVSLNVSAVRDKEGKILYSRSSGRDITERKQAKQALLLEQSRTQIMLNTALEGYLLVQLDGAILDANPAYCKMVGYTRDELLEMRIPDIEALESPEMVKEHMKNIHEQGHDHFQTRHWCKDGSIIDLDVNVNVMEFDGVQYVVSFLRDITDQLRSHDALVESERRSQQLFERAPLSYQSLDAAGNILDVNEAWLEMSGYGKEEVVGKFIGDFLTEKSIGTLQEQFPRFLDTGSVNGPVFEFCNKAGSVRLVEVNGRIGRGSEGEFQRTHCILTDVTERNKMQDTVYRRGEVLTAVSTIAQVLLKSKDWRSHINDALRSLGYATLVSHVYLFENAVGPEKHLYADLVNEWHTDELESQLDNPAMHGLNVNDEELADLVIPLKQRKTVVSDLGDMPDSYKKYLRVQNLLSVVLVPIYVEDYWWGTLGFSSHEAGRDWQEPELSALEAAAATIASAIQQERNKEYLMQALQRLDTAAQGGKVGLWEWNVTTNETYFSSEWKHQLGYEDDEIRNDLEEWKELLHPDDYKRILKAVDEYVHCPDDQIYEHEFRLRHKNGDYRWILTHGKLIPDDEGRKVIFTGSHLDITERKKTELKLLQAATVFDNTREGVVITDANTNIQMINRAFTQLSGYSEDEILGETPQIMASGRHDKSFYTEMWDSINTTGHWRGEIWNRRKNGEIYPELLSISSVIDVDGKVTNYVGVFADISKIKASEAELDFLANHDPLTKLPNRRLLQARLEHSLEKVRREEGRLALLMLDLDRFKNINDSFGHLTGDHLLQQVAARLSTSFRGMDTVTRLGGDEFAVLLEEVSHPDDAARIADKIVTAMAEPWHLPNGVEALVGASVGISLYPEHGEDAQALLQHADSALYRAKSKGRSRYEFYSDDITRIARGRIELEARLRHALNQDELRLYYQPQMDLASNRIIGVEALVRWQHPDEGLVTPDRFIPLAEETGLIAEIGDWVLAEACRKGAEWVGQGLPPLTISINVAPFQVQHTSLVSNLISVLSETGFPAEYLGLEITERTLMIEGSDVAETLEQIRGLGVHLSLDDFGTGYSSLAYLQRYPLNVLKIDRRFIVDVPQRKSDMEIVSAIVSMGHNLGLEVLAEGVETKDQMAFLKLKGCDQYQGYIMSKALPSEEFVEFYRNKIDTAG